MVCALSTRIRLALRLALMLLMALATMGLPLHALPSRSPAPSWENEAAEVTSRAVTPSRQDLTVDEILARHYEAIGGDHHQRVQTMKTTATSVVMGMEAPCTRYAKRHRVELLGLEAVRGRSAYKLRLTMSTGGVQTHYVDTETFYVTRVQSDSGDAVMRYFRLVEGHPVPSVIEMTGPMGEQIIYVDEVQLGVEIDEASFRMR